MKRWIFTGTSGSGRIELLEELAGYLQNHLGKRALVHNIGSLIQEECTKNKVHYTDKRILDLDSDLLKTLRTIAMKESIIRAQRDPDIDFHFISTHATFRWKNRLIPGVSFTDLKELNPDGFVNVVDNIHSVIEANRRNPKWEIGESPDYEETQDWMIEEEFVAEFLADALGKQVYLVTREHNIPNLADLFSTNKKKIYLSYPITGVQIDNPELLDKIQGPILNRLEDLFIVFNPLTIKDMSLAKNGIPDFVNELTHKAKQTIKSRTVARDFQFIDQADAVVVFYLTDKVSPGVLAEIYYAHRHQKPVYMVFPYTKSPFIEDAVTHIEVDIDSLMKRLSDFAAD